MLTGFVSSAEFSLGQKRVNVRCILSQLSPRSTGSWPACGSAGSCRRRRIRTDRRRRRSECTRTWSVPRASRAEPRSEPSAESRTSSTQPHTPHTPDHACSGRLPRDRDQRTPQNTQDQRYMCSTFYNQINQKTVHNMKLWTSVTPILYVLYSHYKWWFLFVPVAFDTELALTKQTHTVRYQLSHGLLQININTF